MNSSLSAYLEKYRLKLLTKEQFKKDVKTWKDAKVYVAFYKEDNILCGCSLTLKNNKCIKFWHKRQFQNIKNMR